ncbi:MAG: hypothetical protein ACK6BN_11670 [Pseudanabaena sp.]
MRLLKTQKYFESGALRHFQNISVLLKASIGCKLMVVLQSNFLVIVLQAIRACNTIKLHDYQVNYQIFPDI